MKEVVERLDLNNSYTVKRGLREDVLYRESPVLFAELDTLKSVPVSFTFVLNKDNKINISDISVNYAPFNKDVVATFGDSIQFGKIKFLVVKPNWNASAYVGQKIHYSHFSVKSAASALIGGLATALSNEKTSIVDISFTSPSIQEADDILTTLIQVYNEHWIRERNQIAVSTSRFIDDRLGVIEKELGNVDSDISSYKSENLMPDVQAVSSMYMNQASSAQTEVSNLSNQISLAEMVRSQLSGDSFDKPLPVNTGLVNADILSNISQYNTTVIERNRLLELTGETNPVVKDRTQVLRTLRGNILASINAYIATLRAQKANAQRQASVSNSKIAANPAQAKYLLSVERQQKVKESLYLFLLQKREENELTQAFTAYNTSIIEEPHGGWTPTFPNKQNIWMMAFLCGFGLPIAFFVAREMLDTKVRGKKDLSSLSIPYIGEIPQNAPKRRGLDRLRKKKIAQKREIVVADGKRDMLNEAFRVVRTNLEFIGTTDSKCKVITITSANPGSGKTFISINLAKSLALKDNKVLLLDLDIRKGSLTKMIGKTDKGMTNYLVGKVSADEIITRNIDNTPLLDAVCMGPVPPNPTELLSSKKLDDFVDSMKEHYDFIIIDCPPVELVTDVRIINRLTDLTIFVIRSGVFDKEELTTVQEFYDEDRYHNMAILLNGTDINSGYGYHRYSYSYHYGYTYESSK